MKGYREIRESLMKMKKFRKAYSSINPNLKNKVSDAMAKICKLVYRLRGLKHISRYHEKYVKQVIRERIGKKSKGRSLLSSAIRKKVASISMQTHATPEKATERFKREKGRTLIPLGRRREVSKLRITVLSVHANGIHKS